jgi:hypothetical protein
MFDARFQVFFARRRLIARYEIMIAPAISNEAFIHIARVAMSLRAVWKLIRDNVCNKNSDQFQSGVSTLRQGRAGTRGEKF